MSDTHKIGCVQHDCDECQQLRAYNTELDAACANLEALNAELVEALQALLNDVGRANSMLGAVKARAALAKAEGTA